MRIYQGQKDLMNSSERECLGKKPPREIGFLKAQSSGLFYQVERHVNFSNKTKSSNLAHTDYQLRGMASTSLLVNSFLGKTLADFYS